VAHPVAAARTRIGRRPGSELVVLHASVSRDHAVLARAGAGWQIRDLGSRNATRIDGRKAEGRATVADGAIVRIGDVGLVFVARAAALAVKSVIEPAMTGSARNGTFRVVLRGPAVELCALGGTDETAGGALLHRAAGASVWTELNLAPLEFQLLRTLCARALEAAPSHRSGGAVLTKVLARALPFQSRFANDENVRQVVRRLRTTLEEIGATDVIETVPGRGYFVAWPVSAT
jgi:FHA domain/Transcriptional regulatory protein, C terminal